MTGSGWHYRALQVDEDTVQVVEAYHTDGIYDGWCEPFVCADNVADLRAVLEKMVKSLDRPVLAHSDFTST